MNNTRKKLSIVGIALAMGILIVGSYTTTSNANPNDQIPNAIEAVTVAINDPFNSQGGRE